MLTQSIAHATFLADLHFPQRPPCLQGASVEGHVADVSRAGRERPGELDPLRCRRRRSGRRRRRAARRRRRRPRGSRRRRRERERREPGAERQAATRARSPLARRVAPAGPGEDRSGLLVELFLHLHEDVARLFEVVAHEGLHHRCLAAQEFRPQLGALQLGVVEALRLLGQARLHIGEGLQVLLEVGAHHALHRVAVEADDLRQRRSREHRHTAGLFLEDDLQQDASRQVLAGLRVAYLEGGSLEHHRLDVGRA